MASGTAASASRASCRCGTAASPSVAPRSLSASATGRLPHADAQHGAVVARGEIGDVGRARSAPGGSSPPARRRTRRRSEIPPCAAEHAAADVDGDRVDADRRRVGDDFERQVGNAIAVVGQRQILEHDIGAAAVGRGLIRTLRRRRSADRLPGSRRRDRSRIVAGKLSVPSLARSSLPSAQIRPMPTIGRPATTTANDDE